MKTILFSTAALLLTTTVTFAGSYTPAPLPPIPAPVAVNDWGGFYVGGMASSNSGEFNYNNLTTGALESGPFLFDDTTLGGAFVGYNMQRGSMVYGVELAFTAGPMVYGPSPTWLQSNFIDAKLRAGYSFGNVMAYALGGFSMGTFDNSSIIVDQTGYVFGAGVDFMVTDNLFVGLEYTARRLNGDIAVQDLETDIESIALRVGWNF